MEKDKLARLGMKDLHMNWPQLFLWEFSIFGIDFKIGARVDRTLVEHFILFSILTFLGNLLSVHSFLFYGWAFGIEYRDATTSKQGFDVLDLLFGFIGIFLSNYLYGLLF